MEDHLILGTCISTDRIWVIDDGSYFAAFVGSDQVRESCIFILGEFYVLHIAKWYKYLSLKFLKKRQDSVSYELYDFLTLFYLMCMLHCCVIFLDFFQILRELQLLDILIYLNFYFTNIFDNS